MSSSFPNAGFPSMDVWQLRDRQALVYTQTESPSPDGSLVSFVYIEWSDPVNGRGGLVRMHKQPMDAATAAKFAAEVNRVGFILDADWHRCKPNSEEQTNPFAPALRVYDFSQDAVQA